HTRGSDLTIYAAINTPGIPPIDSPIDARRLYRPAFMNRTPATGMSKAHDPIMIGNAARGLIPSKLTRIRHGAYKPTPSVISAPRTQLTQMANTSGPPLRPSAS